MVLAASSGGKGEREQHKMQGLKFRANGEKQLNREIPEIRERS